MSLAALLLAAWLQTPPPSSIPVIEPVLFYDSGAITHRELNRANLESIVDFALRPEVTAVIIRARTDTVGSADNNLALAQARGQRIADWLVAAGVSRAIIRIDALGETDLVRPTADGVAEPLNRQVWIDIEVR